MSHINNNYDDDDHDHDALARAQNDTRKCARRCRDRRCCVYTPRDNADGATLCVITSCSTKRKTGEKRRAVGRGGSENAARVVVAIICCRLTIYNTCYIVICTHAHKSTLAVHERVDSFFFYTNFFQSHLRVTTTAHDCVHRAPEHTFVSTKSATSRKNDVGNCRAGPRPSRPSVASFTTEHSRFDRSSRARPRRGLAAGVAIVRPAGRTGRETRVYG